MKEIVGIIAVLLTFVGYAPYVRDILKGKTHPHAYSWFVWGFVTVIVFALQASAHAGPGAYVTLGAGSIALLIFILGLKYGKQDITISDTVFFAFALIATAIWIFAKQPTLSIILLVAIDMLGFAPTVRKSWNKPHSETLVSYQIGALRHGLSIIALNHYSLVTALFPVTWVVANLLFSSMLVLRRKQLVSPS